MITKRWLRFQAISVAHQQRFDPDLVRDQVLIYEKHEAKAGDLDDRVVVQFARGEIAAEYRLRVDDERVLAGVGDDEITVRVQVNQRLFARDLV